MPLPLVAVLSLWSMSTDPVRQADLADLNDQRLDPTLDAAEDAWLDSRRRRVDPGSLRPEPVDLVAPEARRGALQARLTFEIWTRGPAAEHWLFRAEIVIAFDRLFRLGRAVPYRPPRSERVRRRRCASLWLPTESALERWSRPAREQVLGCGETGRPP